jgi:ribosomal protein L29
MTSALEALAKYDPNKGYAEQLSVFGPAANDAVTLLEELGSMIPRRYAQVQPSRETGLVGVVNTLFAAVSIRLKVGNTEVRVDAQAGIQQTQQPDRRGGGDTYTVGNISGSSGVAIGAGASVSVTTYNLSPDDIAHQQSLLTSHRRTLAHYLGQKATMGAGYIPPGVSNGIDEARSNIARIKTTLRGAGVQVSDHPDDVESRRY